MKVPEEQHSSTPAPRAKINLLTQLPLIIALLIIAGLLAVWKPWDNTTNSDARTISVTGEAEITAEPDEYVFSPQYSFKNADAETALTESTAKTNEVVAALKKLGVADSKIKTNTNGYKPYFDDTQDTYYTQLTVTVADKTLAQKVQDCLLTTDPSGSVTPQADFSQAKRKKLANAARDQATKDAREKADQSARNLGFSVGDVKSVDDSPDGGFSLPAVDRGNTTAMIAEDAAAPSTPIQQGENTLTYQVKVVYYLR